MNNKIPRRVRIDLNCPAEKAIYLAIVEVEKLGANPGLTKAVQLLVEAKGLISDYINDGITIKVHEPT